MEITMKQLSVKEVEIMKYIAVGHTAKEVAKEVGLEYRTVETYVARIKKKLGAKNITNAVYIACEQPIWNQQQQ
jgi:DNA-binding NarL/FixJ family response regulator